MLTNQYSTTPLGENAIIAVNITGMIIMIRCCVGSAVDGVIFCCQNMVMPISAGMTKNASGAERSRIQPTKGAPRSSIDIDSSE